jgi:hypothetical protein
MTDCSAREKRHGGKHKGLEVETQVVDAGANHIESSYSNLVLAQ